jgi:catechol 2,3-dioxygenase-like lactoylglutathione lyase family enzyme
MSAIRRVCIDHLTLPVSDLETSRAFYSAVFAALGWNEERVEGLPTWGPRGAEDFSIAEGGPPPGGMHIAFLAADRQQVTAFHAAGLDAGGRDNGAPGPRPQYHEGYYAAFLLDPDGNNVEAVLHERPHEPEPPLVSPA